MRYPFRCTRCAREFVVSRPASEAAAETRCPADGTGAERVFTVPETNFHHPPSKAPAPPSSGFSHSGHSHGPGTAPHTH